MAGLRLALLSLVVVLAIPVLALAKNASPAAKKTPHLLYSNDLQKIPVDARAEYVYALRDFMTANQEKNPRFAEYLMNFLVGDLPTAIAGPSAPLTPEQFKKHCEIRIGMGMLDSDCVNTFRDLIAKGTINCDDAVQGSSSNGTLISSTCRVNGKNVKVEMPTRDNYKPDFYTKLLVQKEINEGRKAYTASPATNDVAATGKGDKLTTAPPTKESNPFPAGPPVATDLSKCKFDKGAMSCPADASLKASAKEQPAPPATASAKKETTRCIYAGFLIKNNDEGGDDSCAPVTNVCSYSRKTIPDTKGAPYSDICKNPANGSCEGNAEGSTVKATGKPKVVCNPLLYGVGDDKHVLCVDRGSDASAKCSASATKDADKINAIIDCKGAKPCPFDDMVKALEKKCLYMHKKVNSDYQDNEAMDQAQFESDKTDGKWQNADDFKKSCQVLLKRAMDIGKEVTSAPSTGPVAPSATAR